MSSDSDRLLIQEIRQGDPRAWETLIARYEGRLLAFVDRRLRDRAASEDVVQETFVGFLNSLPNFDEKRELQTYLFTIASHKLTDHLRRIGRHPMRPLNDSSSSDGDSSQPRADQPAAVGDGRPIMTTSEAPAPQLAELEALYDAHHRQAINRVGKTTNPIIQGSGLNGPRMKCPTITLPSSHPPTRTRANVPSTPI